MSDIMRVRSNFEVYDTYINSNIATSLENLITICCRARVSNIFKEIHSNYGNS